MTKKLAITTGDKLLPAYDRLIDRLIDTAKNTDKFIEGSGSELETIFLSIADSIINTTEAVTTFAKTLNDLTFDGFTNSIKGVLILVSEMSYGLNRIAKSFEWLQKYSEMMMGEIPMPSDYQLEARARAELRRQNKPTTDLYINDWVAQEKLRINAEKSNRIPKYEKELNSIMNNLDSMGKRFEETMALLTNPAYASTKEQKKQQENLQEKLYEANVNGGFIMPVSGQITSGLEREPHPPKGASSFHTGIDIGAKAGSPIAAAGGGKNN